MAETDYELPLWATTIGEYLALNMPEIMLTQSRMWMGTNLKPDMIIIPLSFQARRDALMNILPDQNLQWYGLKVVVGDVSSPVLGYIAKREV